MSFSYFESNFLELFAILFNKFRKKIGYINVLIIKKEMSRIFNRHFVVDERMNLKMINTEYYIYYKL